MIALKFGAPIAAAALLAAAAVGHAQQAQKPQQAQKGAPTAATASPAASPGDDPGLSAAQLREARDDGFKPVTRGKATLYCKSEILVGTAFPMHICYNADRLKVEMRQEEAERMQLRQMHSGGMQGH